MINVKYAESEPQTDDGDGVAYYYNIIYIYMHIYMK